MLTNFPYKAMLLLTYYVDVIHTGEVASGGVLAVY